MIPLFGGNQLIELLSKIISSGDTFNTIEVKLLLEFPKKVHGSGSSCVGVS